jgi:S-adenosylmethionine hydrolase
VLRVDRFGNLVTSIDRWQLEPLGGVAIHVDSVGIRGLSETYADVAEGEPLALIGSGDRLEISIRGGSAAVSLSAGRGTMVRVRKDA